MSPLPVVLDTMSAVGLSFREAGTLRLRPPRAVVRDLLAVLCVAWCWGFLADFVKSGNAWPGQRDV